MAIGDQTPTERALTTIHDARDTLRDLDDELRRIIADLESKVEAAEKAQKEAERELAAADEEHEGEIFELTEALEHVKYWMLDVLVHGKPMSDPRKVLRIVEAALYG